MSTVIAAIINGNKKCEKSIKCCIINSKSSYVLVVYVFQYSLSMLGPVSDKALQLSPCSYKWSIENQKPRPCDKYYKWKLKKKKNKNILNANCSYFIQNICCGVAVYSPT